MTHDPNANEFIPPEVSEDTILQPVLVPGSERLVSGFVSPPSLKGEEAVYLTNGCVVYSKLTSALVDPTRPHAQVAIWVQPGQYFFWRSTKGLWDYRPLENAGAEPRFDARGDTTRPAGPGFYCSDNRTHVGQLLAVIESPDVNRTFAPYTFDVDHSQGGRFFYPNPLTNYNPWLVHFYMNDKPGQYGNNVGEISYEIVVCGLVIP